MLRTTFYWCPTFESNFPQRFLEFSKVFCWICKNVDCFYLFLYSLYTDIVDPTYMSLIHTRSDNNQIYTELNSKQVKSETTARLQDPGYLEPVAIMNYQSSVEVKRYGNT